MATLISSINTCTSRITSGEQHVAQRLEDKLGDDYILWYDVPMGPKNAHCDFCVTHPRWGSVVLEIKTGTPGESSPTAFLKALSTLSNTPTNTNIKWSTH